jgi:hypothetical protein
MKKTLLAVFACSLLLPKVAVAFELRLDAFEPKTPSLSLTDEPEVIPTAMRVAIAGDVATELSASAASFVKEVEALASTDADFVGGGQPAPENAWLAFVLGLVGFGLGHFLIAGDTRGGTRWLIIDLVFIGIWIVLDIAFSALYADTIGGWGFWWLIFDLVLPVGWIVEHVFQGLSAYRATTGRSLFGETRTPSSEGEFATEPNRIVPPIFAWSF